MPVGNIFTLQIVLGYVAWLFVLVTYILPWSTSVDRVAAHRAIATLHSFRFFGLVFLVPGFVGPDLPAAFAVPAAYGDLATALLALAALATIRIRPLFWTFVVGFNVVGTADLILDTADVMRLQLPDAAGTLGAAYYIPIIYVPLLMLTHGLAFYLLWRSRGSTASAQHHAAAR